MHYPTRPACGRPLSPATAGICLRALRINRCLIHRAAMGVREKVLRLAASLLEVSPHDLELADGRVRVKGVPGKELTLGALATVANQLVVSRVVRRLSEFTVTLTSLNLGWRARGPPRVSRSS